MPDKQAVLDRLNKRAFYLREVPSIKWNGKPDGLGRCPFHDDHDPSFSANDETGLWQCFGCGKSGSVFDFYMARHGVDFPKALEALARETGAALETKQSSKATKKIVKTYDYTDEKGVPLFQVIRYEPKTFRQRRPDGKGGWIWNLDGVQLVPFNLPTVLKAVCVFVVEGEKDAQALKTINAVGTTNPMGAGKWRSEFNEYFRDKNVVILPDNDEPGKSHAQDVALNLYGIAKGIKIVRLPGLPEKGDLSNWIESGGTKEKLIDLMRQSPAWKPGVTSVISDAPALATPNAEPPASQAGALKVVSLSDFLSLRLPPRINLLSPWLPSQGLCMIHSRRGVGKTHVSLGIAVAVASGGSFLKWKAPNPRPVLYIDGEMPAVVLQERLRNIIAASDKNPSAELRIITPDMQHNGIPDLSTIEGQAMLEPYLNGTALVILDNLSVLCRTGSENEAESWLSVQEWGLRLRSRGVSVLFVHHSGKGGLQRGTSRREDTLDCVIRLKHPSDYQPDQGARFEVIFEKARGILGNDVKPFEARLVSGEGEGQRWTHCDFDDDLIHKVAELLNDGVEQRDIPAMLGVTRSAISKAKAKALASGLCSLKQAGKGDS